MTFEYVTLDSISGISPSEGSSTSDTTPTLSWEDATEGVYVYNFRGIAYMNNDPGLENGWNSLAVINTTQDSGTVCSGGTCTWTVSPALSPETTLQMACLREKMAEYDPLDRCDRVYCNGLTLDR